ncbi:MAG TPA: MFS transporter, partial [Jatrophihabitans sp.]
ALVAVALLPPNAAVAAAAVLGLSFPPFGPLARTIWPSVLPDEPLRQRAQAFEASLTELVSVIGPVLVTAVTALASPRYAVLTFAAGTLLASVAFGRQHRGVHLMAEPEPGTGSAGAETARGLRGKPAGIAWSRSLIMLFTGVFLASATFGVLEVCLSVSLKSHGRSASLAGLYLGLLALGSVVGGIAYGLRHWTAVGFVRYGRALGVLSLGLLAIAVFLDRPLLSLVMLLAGAPYAAVAAEEFGMVESLAPRHSLARATGLLLSVYSLGEATGLLVAGRALPRVDESTLLYLAAIVVATMALLLPLLRPAISAGRP